MAKKEAPAANPGGGNVIPIGSGSCCVEKCTKKVDKMNFCSEHYTWFKEGLINKKGEKPSDFDKKYMAYMNRKKVA